MQITHNNHFVSQSYLKRWSLDGDRIFCYRILVSSNKVPIWESKMIKSVAYQHDLYTELKDGYEVDDFEKWMGKNFESPVHEVIEKVVRREILGISDWRKLALFLAAQDLRTPLSYIETIEHLQKSLPGILDKAMDVSFDQIDQKRLLSSNNELSSNNNYLSSSIKYSIIPNYDPAKKMGAIKIEVTPNRQLWLNLQRLLLDKTVNILTSHYWSIAVAPIDLPWLTSDHPVIRLNYYDDDKYGFKGGWGVRNGNIMMPLTPKYLLITQIGKRFQNYWDCPYDIALRINKFIAERAFRTVFSNCSDIDIERIRPRKIDAKKFESEQKMWKEWHQQQIATEAK